MLRVGLAVSAPTHWKPLIPFGMERSCQCSLAAFLNQVFPHASRAMVCSRTSCTHNNLQKIELWTFWFFILHVSLRARHKCARDWASKNWADTAGPTPATFFIEWYYVSMNIEPGNDRTARVLLCLHTKKKSFQRPMRMFVDKGVRPYKFDALQKVRVPVTYYYKGEFKDGKQRAQPLMQQSRLFRARNFGRRPRNWFTWPSPSQRWQFLRIWTQWVAKSICKRKVKSLRVIQIWWSGAMLICWVKCAEGNFSNPCFFLY